MAPRLAGEASPRPARTPADGLHNLLSKAVVRHADQGLLVLVPDTYRALIPYDDLGAVTLSGPVGKVRSDVLDVSGLVKFDPEGLGRFVPRFVNLHVQIAHGVAGLKALFNGRGGRDPFIQ